MSTSSTAALKTDAPTPETIAVGDTIFYSAREFAKEYGLSGKAVKASLQAGLSGEEMLKKLTPIQRIIIADGVRFTSTRAFATRFSLNYQAVLTSLKNGLTGDQILKEREFTVMQNPKAGTKPKFGTCTIHETEYPSAAKAAEAFGICPSRVYALKKKKNISAEQALLEILSSTGEKHGPQAEHRKQPCVIGEATYPSKTAALYDHSLSASTVYSRMDREDISFEEAVLRGSKERRRITAASSLFRNSVFQEIATEEALNLMPYAANLIEELTRYKFESTFLHAIRQGQLAVRTTDSFDATTDPIEIFMVFDVKAHLAEFHIPTFIQCAKSVSKQKIFSVLNLYNTEFLGIKFFFNEITKTISANWSQPILKEAISSKEVMTSFFFFLGGAEEAYSKLKQSGEG